MILSQQKFENTKNRRMEIEIKLYLDCVNMQTKKECDFAMLFNNPVKNV